MEVGELTLDDKEYLEEFIKCEALILNDTKLRNLTNLPDIETLNKVSRPLPSQFKLELCENALDGSDL